MEYISLSWSATPLPGLQRLTGTAYPSGAPFSLLGVLVDQYLVYV
jgi:hypothetical protein